MGFKIHDFGLQLTCKPARVGHLYQLSYYKGPYSISPDISLRGGRASNK